MQLKPASCWCCSAPTFKNYISSVILMRVLYPGRAKWKCWKSAKSEYPEKSPLNKARTNNKLNLHTTSDHIGGRRSLSSLTALTLLFMEQWASGLITFAIATEFSPILKRAPLVQLLVQFLVQIFLLFHPLTAWCFSRKTLRYLIAEVTVSVAALLRLPLLQYFCSRSVSAVIGIFFCCLF